MPRSGKFFGSLLHFASKGLTSGEFQLGALPVMHTTTDSHLLNLASESLNFAFNSKYASTYLGQFSPHRYTDDGASPNSTPMLVLLIPAAFNFSVNIFSAILDNLDSF